MPHEHYQRQRRRQAPVGCSPRDDREERSSLSPSPLETATAATAAKTLTGGAPESNSRSSPRDDDGTVGELGDLAGLDGDGILADIGRDFNV